MWNHDEIETAVVAGPDGEWDEPNRRGLSHQTHWDDFPDVTDTGEIRPRWHGRHIDVYTRSKIMLRDGHRCRHCGSTDELQIDHVRPVALGGTDEEDNLQVLCAPCNRDKGARYVG